jgi:hypothetical protein
MTKKDSSENENHFSVKDVVFTTDYSPKHHPGMRDALNFLGRKLFRKRENELKMKFITTHSDFEFSLFGTSHALSQPNNYHNF